MARLRRDEFIKQLHSLMQSYPEFSSILKLLIEQIQKGRETRIQEKLQQLKNTDW